MRFLSYRETDKVQEAGAKLDKNREISKRAKKMVQKKFEVPWHSSLVAGMIAPNDR
jgi:chromosome condensin MukBEF complex kleisin-like MukF subunit